MLNFGASKPRVKGGRAPGAPPGSTPATEPTKDSWGTKETAFFDRNVEFSPWDQLHQIKTSRMKTVHLSGAKWLANFSIEMIWLSSWYFLLLQLSPAASGKKTF